MIGSISHKGLKAFYKTGNKGKINPDHVKRLIYILTFLDYAKSIDDLPAKPLDLHKLTGKWKGYYSVSVTGNWRVIFQFRNEEAYNIKYLDYH